MATPDEKISAVYTQMQNIKTAINTKKGSELVGDNTSEYASAIDGLSVGKNINREISSTGVYQMPSSSFTYRLPSTVTDVGAYALSFAFEGCTGLTSVDLSSLTTVSGAYALYDAFQDCIGLTSVDFSNLTTVSGSSALSFAFEGCTGLASVDFPNLTTVSGLYALYHAFKGCTNLTDIYFRALTTSSFGSYYINQFSEMLSNTGSTVTHTLHFPVDMESTISGLSGYPTFGGTSGYVVLEFDLNGATVVFNVTSVGTPTYYISGKEVSQTSMTKLDDTTYVISSTEGVVTEPLTGLVQYETVTITKDLTTTSFNTITLATDQEDCTVTFIVNGVTLSPTVTSGSNYTLKLNSSQNQTIDYVVKKSGYAKATGTLIYTGSDITENITMTPQTSSIEVNLTPGTTSYGWQTTTVTNPTSWSMYESTNKGVDNSYAVMKVTFSGYETLTCYINSYAESSWDYTIASTLDASTYPTIYSSTTAYANTRSKQYNPTTFDTSHWTTVTYTPSDTGEHFFYIVFRKDSSSASNNDRGYFIINEDQ